MQNNKIVKMIVGAGVFLLAYNFFFGSGIFNGLFESSVAEGKLGAGQANALTGVLEMVATVLSTVGGYAILAATKLIQFIIDAVSEFQGQGDDQPAMTERQYVDYQRVLMQAIAEKNGPLTIMMAEQIAGAKFLTRQQFPQPAPVNEVEEDDTLAIPE